MPDAKDFRHLMSCFATGITVVSLFDGTGKKVGLTVNSFTSVSLEPPLVLFCLDKGAHVFSAFTEAGHFAVNILADDQKAVSQHFADYRHHPEPADIWAKIEGEAPLLTHTLGWMVCRKTAMHDAGDHIIFIGDVQKLHRSSKNAPLVYFHSRYRALAE